MAWLLIKSTPFDLIVAIVGAVSGVTMPDRRPSATKMITLCRDCAAAGALSMAIAAAESAVSLWSVRFKIVMMPAYQADMTSWRLLRL
jgi:multisubunit Na+/H+ antiporter MnhE subunit